MIAANNKILVKMLERLFAGLVSGPSLNCRPHASRQRVDLVQFKKLKDLAPQEVVKRLLGEPREVKLAARVPPPQRHTAKAMASEEPSQNHDQLTPEELAILEAWRDQQSVVNKLRIIADDARTYEQDTGAHVLNVGFPLLSLPPGAAGSSAAGYRFAARRLLAPIAFVPVTVTIRSGPTPSIVVACRGDEVDLVVPNTALLAWLERQTGIAAAELFADERGRDPWREINEIVRHVAKLLEFPASEYSAETPLELVAAPRADEGEPKPQIVTAAVLGLFPMNNQGLLRDMQAMVAGDSLDGPVQSFIDVNVSLDAAPDESYEHGAWSGQKRRRTITGERFVTVSDPCQSRAVRLACECRGLVIHGPPGTGKSQTITNIIGDHLARGERVLMVCDKRTAMDVVANRLDHMGLGSLCALIHDPQRDQRDLYRSIREQLESLTDAKSNATAERKLARVNAELEQLHAELSEIWSLVMQRDGVQAASFHELVGEWLSLTPTDPPALDAAALAGVGRDEFERHESNLLDLFARAQQIGYADNAWVQSAGLALSDFLARPMDAVRRSVRDCVVAAKSADATADEAIPPFASPAITPLAEQANLRTELAGRIESIQREVAAALRDRWSRLPIDAIDRARARLAASAPFHETLRRGPLDAELCLALAPNLPSIAEISQQLGVMEAYLAVASKWYGVLFFARSSRATGLLSRYGLPPGPKSAERLRDLLAGMRARLALSALHRELVAEPPSTDLISDDVLDQSISDHMLLFDCLSKLHSVPALAGLAEQVRAALAHPAKSATLLDGLRRSADRAAALLELERSLTRCSLFYSNWVAEVVQQFSSGTRASPLLETLEGRLESLEDVLRMRQTLAALPPALRLTAEHLLSKGVGADQALAALRQGVLAGEIAARLRANPKLQTIDAQRMRSSLDRYRLLEDEKRGLVRDAVLHRWISRQQQRLLVGTGSRLNSLGADLRRRFTMRGERAMRLRQVIALGQGPAADKSSAAAQSAREPDSAVDGSAAATGATQATPSAGLPNEGGGAAVPAAQTRTTAAAIAGGDPLFDLRPVWMASPETVAQIFPRRQLFDVVVFDEASQCRLEEALPVITRAKRVVVAGDPKQLPPTRFFESALATSEDEETETEQELFEVHQGEIEDLLAATLSINIQQCYLDVHYRSRNSDLIEFSNEQFYSSRLQPIPGHPNNRSRFAPITLYRAHGVYDKRTNQAEAEQVVKIVADLLKRAEAPSIGIACFNIAQRDLIMELLDELAGTNDEFAQQLGEARSRRGAGSFEGLFVKNLENVQGDERDHMIISTTYGPDVKGRFYRRFGPLGRQGGGRRLNVLVTRAREEVHLVTSIPPEVYRNVPPVPAGQVPGGGWLLFSYLAYAERLAEEYEATHESVAAAERSRPAAVHVRPSRTPSTFASELGDALATQHSVGSDVHWGNDGFCVDLALHHPARAQEVTIGVLCDGTRFAQAEDAVEWDVFRTNVLESQGWKLHRVWSPQYFRDREGCTKKILREAADAVANEDAKDGLNVVRSPNVAS
jgi:hypothetical protein